MVCGGKNDRKLEIFEFGLKRAIKRHYSFDTTLVAQLEFLCLSAKLVEGAVLYPRGMWPHFV